MRPRTGLAAAIAAASVLALGAGVPGPTTAQDPLTPEPGSFCTLITDEEASAAFSIELVMVDIGDTYCGWSPPWSPDAYPLSAVIFEGTLAERREHYTALFGAIEDITVGGLPGLMWVGGAPEGEIFTEALGEVLQFSWYDYESLAPEADVAAGLQAVMEAALPRMSSITVAKPTPQPRPSFRTDPDLAAMFPDTIAGQAVVPNTFYPADLLSSLGAIPPEELVQLNAVLASQGKSYDDVTVGQANVAETDPPVTIVAFRVIGGDMSALADGLIAFLASQLENPQIDAAQVAGRDVRTMTDPSTGETSYILTSGDVMWVVSAQEPLLSEIIGQLP